MTRAFYQELRLTLDLIGLKIDDLPHTPQSLLDWQRWARGVCAGIYRERTALRAAEYALRAEARDFESAVIRLAEAAWLAAWALLNGIKNEERGLEYLATARQLAEQVESGAARGLSQPS